MLTQKILNTIKLSRNKLLQSSSNRSLSTSSVILQNNDKLIEENAKVKRQLTQWREPIAQVKKSLINIDPDSKYFKIFKVDLDPTPSGLRKYVKNLSIRQLKKLQEFKPERNEILGPDLGAAHFITFHGGKVKFKNSDKWIAADKEKESVNLPNIFNPNYILTDIDASDVTLYYEGLANLIDLARLRGISFARSPVFDDWCMDKISNLFPNLEYLDISDCPKVSERGLEALYRISTLKTVIVTNHYNSAAFELTCMLLEDCVPGLKIEIRLPSKEIEKEINE